jgi:hypothetical protein
MGEISAVACLGFRCPGDKIESDTLVDLYRRARISRLRQSRFT